MIKASHLEVGAVGRMVLGGLARGVDSPRDRDGLCHLLIRLNEHANPGLCVWMAWADTNNPV